MTQTPTPYDVAIAGLRTADPDRDYIVISHSVGRDLHSKLSRVLAAQQKSRSCTVFFTTWGGEPNGGYRVARALRHHYDVIRIAIPSLCKSAGTLIAIAADELAIGDLGELGPLDIQVLKGSELQENSSGLDIMQALQAVTAHTQDAFHRLLVGTRGLGLSTKLCAEFAANVASGIAAPLIGQIDPIRLGEMQRATRVAYEYGQRLNHYRNNLKPGALERLVSEYPAHGFVIDRKEAAELFHRVSHLTDAEKAFCEAVWHAVEKPIEIDPILLDLQPAAATGNPNENAHLAAHPQAAANEGGPMEQAEGAVTAAGDDPAAPADADGQGVPVRTAGDGNG